MNNDINREISIENVEYNIDITKQEYTIELNPTESYVVELNEQGPQGLRGFTGNGIEYYRLTSSEGLVDTYTIGFTDGNTTTVDVTNGRGITSITGPVSVGNVDTYTVNYNDSTTSTFTVTNGIDGINPTVTVGTTTTGNPGTNASVVNSGTSQDVILDFTIPRGDKGETGSAATIAVGTVTTGLPTDPANVTNVGTSSNAIFDFTIPKGNTGDTGATGNGIASITKTGTVGLVDTYTILYTDGTSTTFTVTNGQNGTGSVADVLVNGSSVLDGQDAKILIKTINSNSITGTGNLDVGTVTSVNNVSPISGNITLSIPSTASDVGALPDSTKYGADLSYSSNTLQLLDQDGNGLGTSVTIQSSPDVDNKSITTNSSDELQTVGVIDNNNTTNAIKTWTGTKAQYDAIVTKDTNTLYNITDDTDVTLTLLELLFPVGAVYFGIMSVCPLQTLGVGTWQALPADKVIQIAGTRGSVGDTLNESLPNITGDCMPWGYQNGLGPSGAFGEKDTNKHAYNASDNAQGSTLTFDASRSSSTYQDNAPVQQDAYLLNGWRRIS